MKEKKVKHEPISIDYHKIEFDNPFLKVKKNKHFFYAERKGVDSIAFILTAKNISDPKRIGIIYEYKNPINKFMETAFGGSIDTDKYNNDLRELVKLETLEEAGFDVGIDDILYHGKVFCSTQMNQFVHLFSVRVDKNKQQKKTTTNPTEKNASVRWIEADKVMNLEDWKTITIVTKILTGRNAQVIINDKK